MIYNQYLHLREEYIDCLILIKVGNFYQLFDEDGIIFNYLFDYKIKNGRVGFPVKSLELVMCKLNEVKINYLIDIKYQIFDDNHYQQVLDRSKEILALKEKIADITNYLCSNIERKYIKRVIDKIQEVIDEG